MPQYQASLFHQLLFRYHILDEKSVGDPGFPPFYNAQFFEIIKEVLTKTDLNIYSMTEKEWYNHLLKSIILTDEDQEYRVCRVERLNNQFDWDNTWSRIRLSGLGPELKSVLFKITHDLLPTQERINKTNRNVSGKCKLCNTDIEEISHALITCTANNDIGWKILEAAGLDRNINLKQIVNLQMELEPSKELPVVWFLASAWNLLWLSRISSKRPELYKIRADLEAKVIFLRKTRYSMSGAQIEDFIANM